MALVWQARVMAAGEIAIPSPKEAGAFLVPFVIDQDGQRFGKYPPGWPALLAIAIRLGLRSWINPLLGALAVWLTYRLGQKTVSDRVGLLAACLTLTSPFFLMNSGTLFSHAWTFVLSLGFSLAWLDTFDIGEPATKPALKWLTIPTASAACSSPGNTS